MPLIPALGRQRQEDLCELEASLVYRANSRIGSKAKQRNPSPKNKTFKQKRFCYLSANYKTWAGGMAQWLRKLKLSSQCPH